MRPDGSLARRILERLPLALFLLALAVGLIACGIAIERYDLFPKPILSAALKTARATLESAPADTGQFADFAETPLDRIRERRIEVVEGDAPGNAVLVTGGRHQFRELCPEHGCLAVAIAPSGEIVHAWPFRPNAIHAANIADEDDYPYELNNFAAERDMHLTAIEQYRNGDLLVTFHLTNAFPYAGGVARIDRNGHPRWFRRDYSHHWPRLTDGDVALIPALAVGDDALEVPNGDEVFTYSCDGRVYRSVLNIVDGDGTLLERIPVLDMLLASPWSGVLIAPHDPCDPLHLNSIDVVGENGGGLAGDIVLSLRNVSAFAILDGETHELKRLVRGTFVGQHDVTHLRGSTFLMFDNRGGDRTGGPSRLLMVDLATGVERTVFPNDRTPEALRGLYSHNRSAIDVSPDGRRAIATFAHPGVAVEVRLADGAVLAVFRSLHDVSGLDQFPEEHLHRAARFILQGVDYWRGSGAAAARPPQSPMRYPVRERAGAEP